MHAYKLDPVKRVYVEQARMTDGILLPEPWEIDVPLARIIPAARDLIRGTAQDVAGVVDHPEHPDGPRAGPAPEADAGTSVIPVSHQYASEVSRSSALRPTAR
ncbi:hypothetical protein V6U89_04950 [Micromonospora sp. CPCC 206171]|uniref:hypothetical protein n=1 Tax=Micromonospora sp. CPCC 206171 TaxID=3122405 RepID=UPI002FF2128C